MTMKHPCDRCCPSLPHRFSLKATILALTLLALASCSGGGGSNPASPAVNDAYTVDQPGGTLQVAAPGVLANDTGSNLTAILESLPSHQVSFTFNTDGSFTYTHDGVGTSDSFSYKLTSGGSTLGVATVTLTINQPPVASNACVTPTTVTSPVSGTLPATDPNGGALSFQILTQPGKGSLTVDGAGNYVYTPTPHTPAFIGMDKFTYQVTDPYGASSTATVWVLLDGSVRIMPLGDSITQGVYGGTCTNPDPDGDCPVRAERISYRKLLLTDLQTLNPSYAVDFVGTLHDGSGAGLADDTHEGHPGDCVGPVNSGCQGLDQYNSSLTRNLSDNITYWLDQDQPDFILLHAGTNGLDSSTVNPVTTNAAAVDTLLQDISTWAQAHYPITVFVARIIPAVDGSLDVDSYNNLVAQIPAGNHPSVRVIMVDQQSQIALAGSPNKADPSYMTPGNNLHPNQTGYDRMAGKWYTDMVNSREMPSCP